MSRLLDFYRGNAPDARGRSLADLWAFSDDDLEDVHDYIQWLFPLREASQYNPAAPLLTSAEIAVFHEEETLRANLRRSLDVYLAFLGLHFEGGAIARSADFAKSSYVWESHDHNWLRITRVLASTRMLGLEAESRAFFDFLDALYRGGTTGITADTFRYWKAAAQPEA